MHPHVHPHVPPYASIAPQLLGCAQRASSCIRHNYMPWPSSPLTLVPCWPGQGGVCRQGLFPPEDGAGHPHFRQGAELRDDLSNEGMDLLYTGFISASVRVKKGGWHLLRI